MRGCSTEGKSWEDSRLWALHNPTSSIWVLWSGSRVQEQVEETQSDVLVSIKVLRFLLYFVFDARALSPGAHVHMREANILPLSCSGTSVLTFLQDEWRLRILGISWLPLRLSCPARNQSLIFHWIHVNPGTTSHRFWIPSAISPFILYP